MVIEDSYGTASFPSGKVCNGACFTALSQLYLLCNSNVFQTNDNRKEES